jgi:hypothetical protein
MLTTVFIARRRARRVQSGKQDNAQANGDSRTLPNPDRLHFPSF